MSMRKCAIARERDGRLVQVISLLAGCLNSDCRLKDTVQKMSQRCDAMRVCLFTPGPRL